jgi:hypothetical protein
VLAKLEAELRDWSQTRPEALPVGYAAVERKLVERKDVKVDPRPYAGNRSGQVLIARPQ